MSTVSDRLRREDEHGFALVFVLFVITVIMMGVTTTLSVTTPNITAAKRTQDVAGALLAAQSGIDDAIAYLTSVPQCRSQTRVCPQAFGASSAALIGTSYQRPTLNGQQSFSWTTGATLTTDGYVRVTSTGTSTGVRRTLVADLSLQPSILSYGYYSDYESQSPRFLNDYYGARRIYLSDPATYNQINPNYTTSGRSQISPPQTATWAAPSSTSNCGEHWYAESSSVRGRALDGSNWTQSGTLNNRTTSPGSDPTCDLVFTTGMTEDGKTYSRDAFDVSYAGGTTGPIFNQPVYTLWGYSDGRETFTSPSPGGQPWRGQALTSSSTYQPVVAPYDITLPTTIGTDGLADNACVYFGPTRVVLNGDGSATVTSPRTTTANPASDPRCYPTGSLSGGVVNFTLNYTSAGSGTIYVKNLGAMPAAGWPDNGTKLTQTPSGSNEVFWFPSSSVTTADPSTSAAASSGCSSSTRYSTGTNATCSWTNVSAANDATAATGWATYGTANCNTSLAATDRELFECEYSHTTGASRPPSDQYGALRSTVQSALAGGTCASGTGTDQAGCVQSGLTPVLATANTGQHPYNYASPANGDHQYYVVSTAGATAKGSAKAAASTAPDPWFSYTATVSAQETPSTTPITTTVYRQTYNATNRTWGAGIAQFSFTITHTDWTVTRPATGTAYFPNPADVTDYNSGTTAADATKPAGSTGTMQPGDLYVEGQNNGQLSLVAQNDVVVTGDVTDYGTTGSDTQAVDLVAGNDVRNYHPVSCVDTNSTDIANTSPGWCPNDITNLTNSSQQNSDGTFTGQAPQLQYANLTPTGDHTIDAAIFTLTGSFRTDNFDRAPWVGNVVVNGGIYQSHRGGNGTFSTNSSGKVARTGLSLNYHYVDLERANLPYAPPASNSANPRPWNVVSISAGSS